jgi:putative ABC transport system permease protein
MLENKIKIVTKDKALKRHRFRVQPLSKINLFSDLDTGIATKGEMRQIYIFSAIAFFILIIACINFTNLSIGLAAGRFKEIGI